MALTKFKLGDLIELIDERNSDVIRNFCGVNINKRRLCKFFCVSDFENGVVTRLAIGLTQNF